MQSRAIYDLSGKTAVVTGGTGVLGREMARALAGANANLVLLCRNVERAQAVIATLPSGPEARHRALAADVLDRRALEAAAEGLRAGGVGIDFLVNGAGGNDPRATTGPDQPFFDLPLEALERVANLNLLGTILPSQVFGREMAERKQGAIVNITSASAARPLTRVGAYSAAKAAVSNFTQWLAVHLATEYAPDIRVNAIMPGFFLTEQNRFLVTDRETGALTARGQKIIEHTPMGRFGTPEDLAGTLLWLLSPASRFVTGVVVPVDGGFNAFAGV